MSFIRSIKRKVDQHWIIIVGSAGLGLGIAFSIKVAQLGAILFFIAALLIRIKKTGRLVESGKIDINHFVLPFYFLICSISLIHPAPDFAWLERGWTLLAFPLVLLTLRNWLQTVRKYFLRGFIVGTLTVGVVNLIIATFRSIRIIEGSIVFDSSAWGGIPFLFSIDHYGNFYFSEYFSFFMHPTYAALMTTIGSAAVLIVNPFNWPKRIQFGITLFQILIVGLLSSRAGIMGMFVTLLIIMFVSSETISRGLKYVLLLVFVVTSIGLSYHPRVIDLWDSENRTFNSNPRLVSWHAAIESIKQNWLLGTGLDRAQQDLNEQYELYNHEEHLANEHNAHNQFLETWLGMGIIGLAMLAYIFFYGFRQTLNRQNIFGVVIMVNLLIHFSFESMLNRFHGLIVLALFYPLECIYYKFTKCTPKKGARDVE